MSDRTLVLQFDTVHWERNHHQDSSIEIFMDGESGTWRLFLCPSSECVDLTLEMLREFYRRLGEIIKQIETDPETYNAEVRKTWASL